MVFLVGGGSYVESRAFKEQSLKTGRQVRLWE